MMTLVHGHSTQSSILAAPKFRSEVLFQQLVCQSYNSRIRKVDYRVLQQIPVTNLDKSCKSCHRYYHARSFVGSNSISSGRQNPLYNLIIQFKILWDSKGQIKTEFFWWYFSRIIVSKAKGFAWFWL